MGPERDALPLPVAVFTQTDEIVCPIANLGRGIKKVAGGSDMVHREFTPV